MAAQADARREERDFLLASLDDLEAEYAAGDLDDADYRALRSDYTTRAARAIRALEQTGAPTATPPRDWRRVGLWTVLVVMVAGLAGVWIAEFSGSRGAGDTITGGSRETVRRRLFEAGRLLGTDPAEARAIYDDILVDEPSNPEALAYRGWLTNLGGDPAGAQPFLESAVASDPTYPDGLVFAAAVALNLGDADRAAEHLSTLDALDVPPFIEQLVQGQGLRIGIVEARLLTGEPDSFVSSGPTVEEVARAADTVIGSEPVRGLELHIALLDRLPDDVNALTEAGWYRGRLAFAAGDAVPEMMSDAEANLTDALTRAPDHAPALVYRAFVRFWLDDPDGARADLAAYDGLDAGREDLDFLLAQSGLGEALN